jgi:hypothetical protein
VPRPRVLCRCGGRIVEYYPRAEAKAESKPSADPPINWHEVGKFIGAKVTGGNPLGAFVGGLVGRIMEGEVLSMTPVIEPPVVNIVGIDRKALAPMGEKIGKAARGAISVGGGVGITRRKRDGKGKKVVR